MDKGNKIIHHANCNYEQELINRMISLGSNIDSAEKSARVVQDFLSEKYGRENINVRAIDAQLVVAPKLVLRSSILKVC